MSIEALEERDETKDSNDDSKESRKRDWEKRKKSSSTLRKAYQTVILVMALIAFTLFMKVFPFPSSFKDDVVLSWQFIVLVALTFALAIYRLWITDSVVHSASFVELDERKRYEKLEAAAQTTRALYEQAAMEVHARVAVGGKLSNVITQEKFAKGYDFVDHMRLIIESLDKQIDYAEEKASRLLEAGRTFVKIGIWLYVASIILWQTYLYYISFNLNAGVIVGMVSTTAIFLIMEFLGAWYLKQYRHYGDSAFSYMKVRSSYSKYMLAYCAINEFGSSDPLTSKADMLQALAESEKWPELKEVNSNDFNYMLQSMESMGIVFEKFKGVFARSNNSGAAS